MEVMKKYKVSLKLCLLDKNKHRGVGVNNTTFDYKPLHQALVVSVGTFYVRLECM